MLKWETKFKLIIVAIVCALLLILGHVLLAKAFADMAWAGIPLPQSHSL